jgi:hypothetical protein
MRKKIHLAMIAAWLICSMLLASCEAISAQHITDTGASRGNGGQGINGGQGSNNRPGAIGGQQGRTGGQRQGQGLGQGLGGGQTGGVQNGR